MGFVHAQAWQAIPEAQLVGLVDTDPNLLKTLGESIGVSGFSNLDTALREVDVDIIDICLPTHLHREAAEAALAAGKHVICEKPLALSLKDARAIIDAAAAAKKQVLVGHVLRFFRVYQKARQLVLDHTLGQIGTIKTFRGGSYPKGWHDWYGDPAKSGTLATDLLIHDFDFLMWCFGPVERVYAKSLAGHITGAADHVLASLRFKSGPIAHVEGTWAYPKGFSYAFEIAGADGLIHFDSADKGPIHTLLRSGSERNASVEVPESPVEISPYQAELAHFLEVITHDTLPVVTAEDGYNALAVSLAVRDSIQSGEPVLLPGRTGGES